MTGESVSVGPMWTPIGYMGYKWSTRSVEPLPPFRRQKLRNQVLVMGTTADPVTPIASARYVAELLGDQAVLVEQLGYGHTTLAEFSSCTDRITADHVMRGIVSFFHFGVSFYSNGFTELRELPAPTGEGDQVQSRQSAWSVVCSVLLGRRGCRPTFCSPVSMREGNRSTLCFRGCLPRRRSRPPKNCHQVETDYSLQHSICITNNFATFYIRECKIQNKENGQR